MNNMFKRLGMVTALLAFALVGFSANWVNFSNFMEVTSLTTRNGNELWVSGKGGLVMYNTATGDKTFFTKGDDQLPSLAVERVEASPLNANIWIGTYDNGLAFLSNGHWTHVPFPDKKAMLYEMKIAGDGTIWASTNVALYRYQNSVFTTYLDYQNGSPWDFDLMPDGRLLCASFQPFIFDPATQSVTTINTSTFAYGQSRVMVIDGNHFVFATDHGDLSFITDTTETDTMHIAAMAREMQMRNGKLVILSNDTLLELNNNSWNVLEMGEIVSAFRVQGNSINAGSITNGGTLMMNDFQYPLQKVSIRRSTISDNFIHHVNAAPNGDLLLIGGEKLIRYHHDTNMFEEQFASTPFFSVQDAIEVNGKFYIGTSYSYLYEYSSANGWQQLGNGTLPSAEVDHITSDPQGNIWFTGPGYLAKYDGSYISIFDHNDNANFTTNLYTRAVHYDETRNAVWFATYDGIFKLQAGTLYFYNENTPGIQQYYDPIETISEDAAHNIWFGTVYGGVIKFDGTAFSTILLPETVGNQFVSGIAFDGNVMYVSDNLHGIWKYENNTWDSLTIHNSPLSSNYVTSLHMDVDGNLWIGSLSFGVDVFSKNGTSIGINEPAKVLDGNIFPNPSNGSFSIQLPAAQKTDISIYNVAGQLIQHMQSNLQTTEIKLVGNESGVYFVKLKTEDAFKTIKLVVR
ncbi:MAG: two-component regulator propeller domain-containing protein [Chitinophagales bacterium]